MRVRSLGSSPAGSFVARGRTRCAAALILAMLALAGCAAPTPSPTSTATPERAAGPVPWIACADILGVDEVGAAYESPPVIAADESTPPRTTTDVAGAQAGMVACRWAEPGLSDDSTTEASTTDGSTTDELSIVLLPDGEQDFAERAPNLYVPGEEGPDGSSWLSCYPPTADSFFPGTVCGGGFLAGSTWVDLGFRDHRPPDQGGSGLEEFRAFAALIADRLAGVAPGESWIQPAGVPDTTVLCSDDRGPALTAVALDVDPATVTVAGIGGDPGIYRGPEERAGVDPCGWMVADGRALVVSGVVGGAWVFEEWASTPPVLEGPDGASVPLTPVEMPGGADAAFLACLATCEAYLDIGGTLFFVSLEGAADADTARAGIERFTAALAAELGS